MKVLPINLTTDPLVEASTQTSTESRQKKDQRDKKDDSNTDLEAKSQTQIIESRKAVSEDETASPSRQIIDSEKLLELLSKSTHQPTSSKFKLIQKLCVKTVTDNTKETSKKI